MITNIRNYTQSWVVKILLGLLVVTFVVGFGVGTFSNPREVLVTIGEQDVSVQEYERAYAQRLNSITRNYDGDVEALVRRLNLRQQVYDQLVDRRLLLLGAQELGLYVPEADIAEIVREQEAFHLDGAFDYDTYRRVLTLNRFTPATYEGEIRSDLLVDQLRSHYYGGAIAAPFEMKIRSRVFDAQTELAYVVLQAEDYALKEAPGDEALNAYYEEHLEAYRRPRAYKVEFFVLRRARLQDKRELSERAIARYYERRLDSEYTTKDEVRARHILKRVEDDADTDAVFAARDALTAIRKQAEAEGADFAALAEEHSDDDGSAKRGGDLGFFAREAMVAPFAEAAYALTEPGELSPVVRSNFGFHLIQLVEKREARVKTLEEVRDDIVYELRKARAERRLNRALRELPPRIPEEGLADLAAEFEGVQVYLSEWFDADSTLPQLTSTRALYEKIGRAGKVDDWGALERNPLQGHVFYRVAEVREPSTRPFEEVKAEVAEDFATKSADEALREAATTALESLKNGEAQSLDAWAKQQKHAVAEVSFKAAAKQVDDPIGENPEFVEQGFRLTEEQPYATLDTGDTIYLMQFLRRSIPQNQETPELFLRDQIERAWQVYFFDEYINSLRERYPVRLEIPGLITSQ